MCLDQTDFFSFPEKQGKKKGSKLLRQKEIAIVGENRLTQTCYTDEFWVTEGRSCFCMHISAKQSQAFLPIYIFRVFSSHSACFWKN